MTAAISLTSVAAQAPAVQASMKSADEAVQAHSESLGTTDVTQWNGIKSQFDTWYAGLQKALSYTVLGVPSTLYGEAEGYYEMSDGWAPSANELSTYQATANGWQQRISSANPNYQPPPPPPAVISQTPGVVGTLAGDLGLDGSTPGSVSAAKVGVLAVVGTVVVGGIVYAAVKIRELF